MKRLWTCIHNGISQVARTQIPIRNAVREIWAVQNTIDEDNGSRAKRKGEFHALIRNFKKSPSEFHDHFSRTMTSWEPGLFIGPMNQDLPVDNLDLERWFRIPKGHERKIHGRRHAGVRIVREGPSMMLALDVHSEEANLLPIEILCRYRNQMTSGKTEKENNGRGKIMRKARSTKKRKMLLQELEMLFVA